METLKKEQMNKDCMCSVQIQTEEMSKISSLTQTTNDVVTLMTSVGTNTNSNPSFSGINKAKSLQCRKSFASQKR